MDGEAIALIEACNPKIAISNIMRNSRFTEVSLALGFGHGKPVCHAVTQSKKCQEIHARRNLAAKTLDITIVVEISY